MPSKKKKYNARFPAGRIKKIMQSDEEVGKVAQAVPIIISRTLELFVESMLTKTLRITNARNAKTLSPSHMKQCIMSESRFDFLRELVKNIPDISIAEEQWSEQAELNNPAPVPAPSSIQSSSSSSSTSHVTSDDYASNLHTLPMEVQYANDDAVEAHTKRKNDSSIVIESSTVNTSGEPTINIALKYSKTHPLDTIGGKFNQKPQTQNFYMERMNNDHAIDYSLKADDREPNRTSPRLMRMESAPSRMTTTSKRTCSSTISQAKNCSPVSLSAAHTPNEQAIMNFDFTKVSLLPFANSTPSPMVSVESEDLRKFVSSDNFAMQNRNNHTITKGNEKQHTPHITRQESLPYGNQSSIASVRASLNRRSSSSATPSLPLSFTITYPSSQSITLSTPPPSSTLTSSSSLATPASSSSTSLGSSSTASLVQQPVINISFNNTPLTPIVLPASTLSGLQTVEMDEDYDNI